MDYELKYVIAIFLLVKIAALSPEFSISEEKEKLKQSHGLESPPASSLAAEGRAEPSASGPYRGKHFSWGSGQHENSDEMRLPNLKDVGESKRIKENQSFDICERKLELLESPLKWRNIQKTLRWLDRVLSSKQNSMEQCGKRKAHERRSSPDTKTKNYEFYQSKNKKFKSFFKRKKPKKGKYFTSDVKSKIHSGQEKKFKRKGVHKHGFWRNWSKNRREELKREWKGPRYERKQFFSNPPQMNITTTTTTTKPSSALFNVKRIFLKRAKNRNVNIHDCVNINSELKKENCMGARNTNKAKLESERSSSLPKERWSGEKKSREHDSDTKVPKQKSKAWPNFVYHRVSSNFFHPELAGHNHRQSDYVAISVATSSKPEKTDNKKG